MASEKSPADHASRGMKAEKFLEAAAWFNGPEFLWDTELPSKDTTPSVDPDDPELKRVFTLQADTFNVYPSLL